MNQHDKVAVFGAGSWGTAFSIVLADAGNDVTIWARREELCAAINETHENPDYLPGIELPAPITATHDPEEAAAGADIVVLAVPSQTLRANLEDWAPYVAPRRGARVADEGRRARHAEADERGDRRGHRRRPRADRRGQRPQPVQGDRPPRAGRLGRRLRRRGRRQAGCRTACHSPAFRPTPRVDVLGCELGGAYKNVVGLAVGMAVGSASATTRPPR